MAALNGAAAGVGLAWALTCDLVIASERAVIVPAFGRLGLIPEVGTSWALTRRLGYQGALAYYLRGDHIDAPTALRLGLVQEVVAHDRLLEAADEWCSRVAEMPPHADRDDETAAAGRRRRRLERRAHSRGIRRTDLLHHRGVRHSVHSMLNRR